jgi:hypothetical protein
MSIHTHTHTCIYAYWHTYIYMYTHTYNTYTVWGTKWRCYLDVHSHDVSLFMPSGLNDLSLCIQNFSLFFFCASVQWRLWSMTTTVISSHLWPLRLKCSPTGSLVGFFGGVLMVDRWLFALPRRSSVSKTYCFEQALQRFSVHLLNHFSS